MSQKEILAVGSTMSLSQFEVWGIGSDENDDFSPDLRLGNCVELGEQSAATKK